MCNPMTRTMGVNMASELTRSQEALAKLTADHLQTVSLTKQYREKQQGQRPVPQGLEGSSLGTQTQTQYSNNGGVRVVPAPQGIARIEVHASPEQLGPALHQHAGSQQPAGVVSPGKNKMKAPLHQ